VWLPLAVGDLCVAVAGIGGVKVDKARLLESWCLPELGAALRNDEDAADDELTVMQFERLDKMFGKSKD